ncbi:MAG: hypothetical protein V1755_14095 [Chloroflexota bacterium]
MTTTKKAALEALGNIIVRLPPGDLELIHYYLDTIRAALQPTAVERVLEMGGGIWMNACQCDTCKAEGSRSKWRCELEQQGHRRGPTPEAAAQAALDAMATK